MNISDSSPGLQPYFVDRIMLPNYEQIKTALPHRLYADNNGCWMEIQTKNLSRFFGESGDYDGIIVGIKLSGRGEERLNTFFIDSIGNIYLVDFSSGIRKADFDVNILYMLLNPLDKIGNWSLQDVKEAQKNYSFDTNFAFGMKTHWGSTSTFHPDLELAMEQVKDAILRQL